MMSIKPTIFLSYAWGDPKEAGTSREKIVDELHASLSNDGFQVIRDKVDLGYKGLISEFMQKIGKGDCIVIVISDKYLKSAYCMFELLEIYRKSNSDIYQMREKIIPIVLEDARIYDPEHRLDYVAYWKKKKEDLDKKVAEVGLEYAVDVVDDFKIYREITSNIGLLAGLLKDLNTLNPTQLTNNNFEIIKKELEKFGQGKALGQVQAAAQPGNFQLGNFRKFFENVTTDAAFNGFCMDNFEPVYNKFTDNMNKLVKINLLLDHCKRNGQLMQLLALMEDFNPTMFVTYQPYEK